MSAAGIIAARPKTVARELPESQPTTIEIGGIEANARTGGMNSKSARLPSDQAGESRLWRRAVSCRAGGRTSPLRRPGAAGARLADGERLGRVYDAVQPGALGSGSGGAIGSGPGGAGGSSGTRSRPPQ